jgi:lipoprotein NlpI
MLFVMTTDPWKLLQRGPNSTALRQMRKGYEKEQDASHIMELGVAYLWVEDYQAAWQHFDAVNQRDPGYGDSYYGMAGAAKWCLGEPDESIRQWREGTQCRYADGAGGVSSRLWLYIASVIKPRLFPRNEAEELLTVCANDRRVKNWPGPVAEYILGRIDENNMRTRGSTYG